MKLEKNQQNLQEITNLIEYAFNKKPGLKSDPVFLARYNNSTCYGNLTDNKVTSLVMVNHFQSQLYQQILPLAGIGYVASYPEVRGDGGVTKIMDEILADLVTTNVPVSLLAPFSEGFYRRFGYENVTRTKHYHFDKTAFNYFSSEKKGSVKRGTWADQELQELVINLYQRKLAENKQSVSVVREQWWWDRQDQYYQNRFNAVCFDEDEQPVGYLIYRMIGNTFLIDELCYFEKFALRKLLTFVKSHVSSFENFDYDAPIDEILETCFTEQEPIEITIKPYMMGRIVDFKRVIESIDFQQAGTFYFEVTHDQQCPQNQGVWKVDISQQTKCEKVQNISSDAIDVTGEIGAWTRLLLGDEKLNDLVFLEQLVIKNKKDELENVFPQAQHTFYDYF